MSRQITFDWQIDEEEFERRLAQHGEEMPAELLTDGERKLALIVLRGLAALVFVVLASASAPLSPRQIDRMQIESELTPILEFEEDAWRDRDRERYDMLIDPAVHGNWVGEWRDNWGARSETGQSIQLTLGPTRRLDEELVQANVYVSLPRTGWWQPAAFRETRFYRSSDGVWLRTLPSDTYWGEPQSLETSSFVFHYYTADTESVRAAASRLDAAYTELYRTLGLGLVPDDERILVFVKPGMADSRGSTDRRPYVHVLDRSRTHRLEVTSPILSEVPQGVSNADYLTERVFSRLTNDLLRNRRYIKMRYDWAFVRVVMRGWLVQELLDQPSGWRQESAAVFRQYAAGMYPLRLADVDDFLVSGKTGRETALWRYEAASSLLDYVVATRGPDILPALMAGFAEHASWQPLIEDVFETSLEEFTQGWNEYLAVEYGLQEPGSD